VVEGVGDVVGEGVGDVVGVALVAGAEAPADADGAEVAITSTTKISSSFGVIDP